MPIAGVFLPWWGPAPGWQDQFIRHALTLYSVAPILVGDAAAWCPEAMAWRVPCTMDEFESRASEIAGVPIHKCDPRYPRGQALCELRPLMADMYPDVIQGCEWWGWGDWDCVWGDWDSFLTPELLAQYDMISSCSYTVNGPFQLFRNTPEFTRLYRERLDLIRSWHAEYLDERGMQQIVASWVALGRIRCLYPKDLDSHDRNEPWTRCTLRHGKLYRMDKEGNIGGELLNFHFPGSGWPL